MMKLQKHAFDEIRTWIARNSRPLEWALWCTHFEGGNKESVADALAYYQNADGGFGHGVEPDSWNPESSPYSTLFAVNTLLDIGIDASHPLFVGALRYFDSGVHSSDIGWFFSIPTNNNYPHAPWWHDNGKADTAENIGLTAEITAFVLLYAAPSSPLAEKALAICRYLTEKLLAASSLGEMGAGGFAKLLASLQKNVHRDRFDIPTISAAIDKMVNATIQRDPAQWAYYNTRPTDLIQTPDSPYYSANADIVSLELDYLLETRVVNGVWPITWSWFQFNDTYNKEFAICENWWKGIKAIDKMVILRNFDRIE